ncbi:hypothetical protein [Metabacillus sp. Hm71]|uniref:hypothetical protein n=1 Tax=Metabacillus sp. Hm71 TaxID=3450743 RepID=UPI003F4372B8
MDNKVRSFVLPAKEGNHCLPSNVHGAKVPHSVVITHFSGYAPTVKMTLQKQRQGE